MINVGIIGAGYLGQKRAEIIRSCRLGSIRIICDKDLKKAAFLAGKFSCGYTDDWRKVIKDARIKAAVVATTNDCLASISSAALRKGLNVFCEKPMARDIREARSLCNVSLKSKGIFSVGFTLRFHPAIRKAWQLSRQGAIGRILFCRAVYGHGGRKGYDRQWRMKEEISGGGELMDQGVHLADLFRWFMGEFYSATCVNANLFWRASSLEDNTFFSLRTKDKRIASAHCSTTQWKNRFFFEVFGQKGYLIVDGLGKSYGPQRLIYGRRTALGSRPSEKVYHFTDEDACWRNEWSEFARAIKQDRKALALGCDGLKAQEIIAACYRAARLGRTVRVGGK